MAHDQYEQNGSLFVEQVFDPKEFKLIQEYIQMLFNNSEVLDNNEQYPYIPSLSIVDKSDSHSMGFGGVVSIAGVDFIDYMMTKIQPKIESIVGIKILPKKSSIS